MSDQEPFTREQFVSLVNNKLKKELCIDFLEWMNRVSAEHSMALETTPDDIVEMYLNKTY